MQTWDTEAYGRNGTFVHQMAAGVLEWLDARPSERILDLGCGDGQLTLRLAATGAEITAVDVSPEMVAAARARGVRAGLANAESLPYAKASFDAVFSNAVLHWVRNHDALLSQVHRVLKPGGRFVAEMGGHGNIAAIRVAMTAALKRHGLSGHEESDTYYPSADLYARRLRSHQFRVERIALIPRPTPLGDGGIAAWIKTFRRGVLDALPESLRETVVAETAELLAPVLRDDAGGWTADYMRLRFIAIAD